MAKISNMSILEENAHLFSHYYCGDIFEKSEHKASVKE